uniref:Uncharacterized protein n=1 Tax=Candidatus Kentrum sp. FM TaxID=2126340 RepID=A0A450VZD5_9GAMM|nr:MAG: hypothetical protein BECKFM1743C_GA0114222_1011915 [Candidatus Kentron sp. FM]VFJ61498.1 MAG: hypothetical protein BECKFM1743A_GA0114220_102855 [Candidatus Kentron sp. FM]VFK10125.1 MAG: hypothetical protein BECKFM1743B_GA0114221_101305 [Candidatus Kentron sp. FM]
MPLDAARPDGLTSILRLLVWFFTGKILNKILEKFFSLLRIAMARKTKINEQDRALQVPAWPGRKSMPEYFR